MGSIKVSETFDYVIVGGGTAGLTVANRLSEDAEVNVLVIEAGKDNSKDPLVLTPGLMAGMYGNPEYDWNFTSVPQPELDNRKISQPRGKQLGGTSAINFMLAVHPSRPGLDAWGALGNEGWNFDTLAPYFRKFATVHPPPQAAKDVVNMKYHDDSLVGDGPVQLSFSEGYGAMNSAWLKTFSKLGLEMITDVRSGNGIGAFQQAATIDPGTKTRSFAATAYYTPEVAKRPNLTVLTETVVKKIIFDINGPEPVATGVLIQTRDGTEQAINAGEVILAAGALMTPQILEVSGVGSKALLDSLNIPVIVDNPSVGENLQDHPVAGQCFEVNSDVPSSDVMRDPNVLNALIGQYQATREGPLGQSNSSIAHVPLADASGVYSIETREALFAKYEQYTQTEDDQVVRKLLGTSDEPSIQYMVFPGQMRAVPEPINMSEYLIPTLPENYLTVLAMLNHPFSRGSVHISSADIHKLPTLDPKYNTNPLDLEISARHFQFIDRLVNTAPFSGLLKPGGARFPDLRTDDLENAKKVVQQTTVSTFHLTGSCAMKPRERGGVVDTRLRVHGIKGLRIVDASIMPLVPGSNIQTTVYAVAERAADLIKEDRK